MQKGKEKESKLLEVEKLAKKDQKKLTPKERRRVRDYRIKKAKIPPFDEKCKQCDKPIPAPLEFCSSDCKESFRKRRKSKCLIKIGNNN